MIKAQSISILNSCLKLIFISILFRGKLESAIASHNHEAIPIVVVVLEGGPNTISTVLASVRNGSPCVFVDGSGKCADLFAFVLSKLAIRDDPLTLKM